MRKLILSLLTLIIFSSFSLVNANSANANDSGEAFMSATFGLSAARTQKRMENSGATVLESIASSKLVNEKLVMKGTFEYRSAIFVFNFYKKKGLNHKSVYIASSGNTTSDNALYEGLRDAYNVRFGKTKERAAANQQVKGRIVLQNLWQPNKDTTISLFYNPEITGKLPGDSLSARPIKLIYNYIKWN